jgi:hypothetical protein
MPQGPIPVSIINTASQGAKNTANITANTVIKAARGTIIGINVIVAGSAAGAVYDAATVAAAAAANQVGVIPNQVGAVPMPPQGIPCLNGIVVEPGAGQTIAVFWI